MRPQGQRQYEWVDLWESYVSVGGGDVLLSWTVLWAYVLLPVGRLSKQHVAWNAEGHNNLCASNVSYLLRLLCKV